MKEACCLVALLILLSGCEGGRRQHTVVTGTVGSLEGLAFSPPDHSLEVETDTDPEIFWVRGTPPSQFTAALKRIDEFSQIHSVPTELVRLGPENTYRWKLRVSGSLQQGTLYSIVVSSSTERKEAWFLTEKTFLGLSPADKQGGGPAKPERDDKGEHVIRIGQER